MKLQGIKVDNFCRIKCVEIKFAGESYVVGGRNKQGKSALFNAIKSLLGGKTATPKEPIRKGADKAVIEGTFDDLVITKTITEKTERVVVKGRDGVVIPGGPQGILDKLFTLLTFDPNEFCRMDGPLQAETIRKLVGLDFAESDAERDRLYAERKDINKDLKRAKAAAEEAPNHADAPAEEVSVADLIKEVERRRAANVANDAKRQKFGEMQQVAKVLKAKLAEDGKKFDDLGARAIEALAQLNENTKTKIDRLKNEIKQAEAQLVEDEAKIKEQSATDENKLKAQLSADDEKLAGMIRDGRAMAPKVKALVDEDLDEIAAQIETAEVTNQKVRENARYAELISDAETHKVSSDTLTAKMKAIDEAKAKAIAEANYPVPGLSVDDTGVRFNDLPFDQASEAEQIHVSVAIGAALNPELQLLLVRGASLLDPEGRATLLAEAEAADMQLLVEVVGEEGASVVIEGGVVKEG